MRTVLARPLVVGGGVTSTLEDRSFTVSEADQRKRLGRDENRFEVLSMIEAEHGRGLGSNASNLDRDLILVEHDFNGFAVHRRSGRSATVKTGLVKADAYPIDLYNAVAAIRIERHNGPGLLCRRHD